MSLNDGYVKRIKKTLAYSDFTDGGSTAGTYTLTASDGILPPGAIVLGWRADVTTGFTGDTTCTCQVGKSGTAGAFSTTTTGSVFTSLTQISSFTVVATANVGADAIAPLVTLTSGADFTSVTAGSLTLYIYYLAM